MRIIALFAILEVLFILSVIIIVVTLLWRMAKAQEQTARHLYEIARDIKLIALKDK